MKRGKIARESTHAYMNNEGHDMQGRKGFAPLTSMKYWSTPAVHASDADAVFS